MRHIFLLAMLCPFLSMCQPISLKGKIINEQHQPVAGATITVKRAAGIPARITTVASNNAGEFSITHLGIGDTITVTAVGYEPRTQFYDYTLTKQSFLTIMLHKRVSVMDEVVVNTGYQLLPKERATGSFSFVDNHTLNMQHGTNVLARLNGVAPAVAFDNSPNHPPLTIRGLSTIKGPKAPLIVLDNFPFDGDINNINPVDVESITILKDAAAASIWGARAGNGVIVITTKKGRYNQRLQVSLSSSLTVIQKPDLNYLKPISTSDFIGVEQFLFEHGYYNSAVNNSSRPVLNPVVEILFAQSAGQISEAEAKSRIDALRTLDVRNDYHKYVYQPAVNQQYSLQLNGGSSKASYLFSAGLDRNRNELDAPYNRISLRTNNSFEPFKNLRLSTTLFYTTTASRTGKTPYGEILQSTKRIPPYTQLADADGTPLPIYNYRQSYIDTAGDGKLLDWKYYPLDNYKHDYTTNTLQLFSGNFALQYSFLHGFTLDLQYRYDRQQSNADHLRDIESYFTRDLINTFTQLDRTTGTVKYIVPNGAVLSKSTTMLQTHSFRPQLNFTQQWDKHALVAIAGSEIRQTEINSSSFAYYGFNPDLYTSSLVDYTNTYPTFIRGSKQAIPDFDGLSSVTNRFVSFYGNAAYTLNKKYTVSASARKDASNLFGLKTNEKWKPLWSAGLAWNISDEPFYLLSALPYLKWRFTYGFSGNIDPSKSAVTTMRYAASAAAFTNYPNASINQFANPFLRWETLRTLNIGLDFETRNRKVNGSVDFYLKKGTDLFGSSPIDYTTGLALTSITRNVASMKAKGMELTLTTRNIDRKLKWNTTTILNYNTSRITDYFLPNNVGANYLNEGSAVGALVGKPLYSIITYKFAGLDSLGNPQGWLDGKPSTNYTSLRRETLIGDLVYSGSAMPPVWGSVLNSLSWKNFSLAFNITFKFNYWFQKDGITYVSLFSQGVGNSDFALRWQKPGDEAINNIPSMTYPANSGRDNFYNSSEALIRKAAHIRLQFINLSYNCMAGRGSKGTFNQLELFLNAANLPILWRANNEGIDPDYLSGMPPGLSTSLGFRASF